MAINQNKKLREIEQSQQSKTQQNQNRRQRLRKRNEKLMNAIGGAKNIFANAKHGGIEISVGTNVSVYSPSHQLASAIQQSLDRQLKSGAVKTTESGETVNLQGIDQRRSIAALYVKRYAKTNKFLASLLPQLRKKALTEKQIAVVEEIIKKQQDGCVG